MLGSLLSGSQKGLDAIQKLHWNRWVWQKTTLEQSQNRNLGSGDGTAGDDGSINTVCNMNAWKAWLFSHEPRRRKLWENPTNPVSKSRGERRPVGQAGRWWLQHLEATLWFVNGRRSGCSLCNCAWLQLDDVQVVLDQSRDRLCPGGRRKQNLSSEVKGTDSKMLKYFKWMQCVSYSNELPEVTCLRKELVTILVTLFSCYSI